MNSEKIAENVDSEDTPQVDELQLLKTRAKTLNIPITGNVNVATLKAKIEQVIGKEETPENTQEPLAKKITLRQQLYRDNMKLVRVRVTCLDPKKKELFGEVISIGNEYIGNVRKFVPFGEGSDNGYHIPYCIYNHLKNKTFLSIREIAGNSTNGGRSRISASYIKEYVIDVLPTLTPEELKDLAIAQAASGSISREDAD